MITGVIKCLLALRRRKTAFQGFISQLLSQLELYLQPTMHLTSGAELLTEAIANL